MHTILLVISIALITFGLYVGIKAQGMPRKDKPVVHFYSLHSWTGLVSVGLFALQVGFCFGFQLILSSFVCYFSLYSVSYRFWFCFSAKSQPLVSGKGFYHCIRH